MSGSPFSDGRQRNRYVPNNRDVTFDGSGHNDSRSCLDAVATAVLADVDIAAAALQDVLVMACIAHLASETSPGRAMEDALEAPRMLAFMIVLQFGGDPVNILTPHIRKYVRFSVSVHDLFCTLYDTIGVCCTATAFLPACATLVTELGLAVASSIN